MSTERIDSATHRGWRRWSLKLLVGSGDRIAILTLPFAIAGILLDVAYPSYFSVGGPTTVLLVLGICVLLVGVAVWAWSAALILIHVPKRELITTGPYTLAKHPLYSAVALLVLPAAGILLNTWVGLVIGAAMYMATRIFAPAEERELSRTFGAAWESYGRTVRMPWL